MISRVPEIMRLREAARRDRTPGYRELYEVCPGREVLCESKSDLTWWEEFCNGLRTGQLQPNEFSIREIFERTIKDGRELADSLNPRFGPNAGFRGLMEAAGAITSGDFSSITGQILYTRMMQDLTPEQFVFQGLIPTQPTQFSGEKIPGIANLGDQAEVVAENENYPLVGTGEDYIETPATTKRGFIVPVTKEAIFFDRTGMLLQKAGAVGESLRLNKEKRAIDCIIDENTTTHRYKWRGTTYATYQTTSPWDNTTASATLENWTDIDAADQTLNGILDPNTGEPVVIEGDTLICTKQNEKVASYIRDATGVSIHSGGYATSGELTETTAPNPVGRRFTIISSRLLAARMATDTTWYYGNPRALAVYMENWPITVTQAPAGSAEDFHRDVVNQFKCSERGQFAVIQPRVMTKCTVA